MCSADQSGPSLHIARTYFSRKVRVFGPRVLERRAWFIDVPYNACNMLLTITNTKSPASDLGYLLHKNPARCQSFELAFGKAHVFYPEVSSDRCTAALLLDVDPVGLVRNRRGPGDE